MSVVKTVVSGAFSVVLGSISVFATNVKGAVISGVVESFIDESLDLISGALSFKSILEKFRNRASLKQAKKDIDEKFEKYVAENNVSLKKCFDKDFNSKFKDEYKKIPSPFSDSKEEKKGFNKLLSKSIAKIKKEELYNLKSFSAEVYLNEIFGEKIHQLDKECKEHCIKIFAIIREYVFSRMFINMSLEDRTLAKTIHYMLEDQTNQTNTLFQDFSSKIEEFRYLITAIMQQHESGMLSSATSIKLAQGDPFLFVKLECPECHASGKHVLRKGDRAFCAKCGASYDIIKNVDEVKDLIVKAQESIEEELCLQGVQITEMKDIINGLACEVVTESYLENSTKEIESFAKDACNDIKHMLQDIIDKQNLSDADMKALISNNFSAVKEAVLVQRNALDALNDYIIHEVTSNLKKIEKITHDTNVTVHDTNATAHDTNTTVRDMNVTTHNTDSNVLALTNSFNSFRKTFEKNENRKQNQLLDKYVRTCPFCERDNVTFSKIPRTRQYKCPICGYIIDNEGLTNDNYSRGIYYATYNVDGKIEYIDGQNHQCQYLKLDLVKKLEKQKQIRSVKCEVLMVKSSNSTNKSISLNCFSDNRDITKIILENRLTVNPNGTSDFNRNENGVYCRGGKV